MNPFRNILRLSVGDFVAKALHFLAFVHLARVLGVANYGVLEFAISVTTYFLLLADGGLELWATREAAQGADIQQLVARIVPLRCLLCVGSFGVLFLLLPAFPSYPSLRTILVLFGLTLFAQAANLKWVFMGREQMTRVAVGLMVAQIVFAVAVFVVVRGPAGVVWVPVLRLAGDVATAVYFGYLYVRVNGKTGLTSQKGTGGFTLRGASSVLWPALILGASHGLALVSYNFDSVLMGFMLGDRAVGWYNAAYKPVTAVLAMPVTYFLGLFPVLSRTFSESHQEFQEMVARSLRTMSILAVPVGVGGTFLAKPIIDALFGPAYANSVPAFQVLSWSAALVMLRGTYRQALNAAGRSTLDLRCAGVSTALNLCLNLLLIPHYGIVGAATATVLAEVVWLVLALYYFYRPRSGICDNAARPARDGVVQLPLLPALVKPVAGSVAMAVFLFLTQPLFWVVRGFVGGLVYFGVLWLLGAVRLWRRSPTGDPVLPPSGRRSPNGRISDSSESG